MHAWCFQCGTEYVDDVTECFECGVATVDYRPTPAYEVGGEDDDQVAYEFHDWSYEARLEVEKKLHADRLAHGWQGPSLIVLEADEDQVDALVERIERAHNPLLAKGAVTSAYEVADWADADKERIQGLLVMEDIEFAIDADGDLVVAEADEDKVDALFDRLAEPVDELTFGDGVDGIDEGDAISDLFLFADRLKKSATDHKGVLGFMRLAEVSDEFRLPFGWEPQAWRAVLDAVQELEALLGADEEVDDEEVELAAEALHAKLRPYV